MADRLIAWLPGCLVADSDYIVSPEELEWDAKIDPVAQQAANVVRVVDEAIAWMMRNYSTRHRQ